MGVKRQQERKPVEWVHYVVTVTGWDHYYSFGVGHKKYDSTPYRELHTLSFRGDLIRPGGSACRSATVTLSAKSSLLNETDFEAVKSIGLMEVHDNHINAYIFMPEERMSELAAVAISGRVKVVSVTGHKLKWRRALATSVSLSTEFNEDDY
ncbi:MAG: hypothetical protein ACREEL_11540 [Stellaceae bacterium]